MFGPSVSTNWDIGLEAQLWKQVAANSSRKSEEAFMLRLELVLLIIRKILVPSFWQTLEAGKVFGT